MRTILGASFAALVLAFTIPAVASAGTDSNNNDSGDHITVHFPKDAPGHRSGDVAQIDICPWDSFDALRNHFDGAKTASAHDAVDRAFADAIKTNGKKLDDAFDVRHKNCDKKSHDESASHSQTKIVPKGSVDAGDGSTEV